eukprot:COSAG01_NODE_5292_length_4353_cov_2.365538_2_plen_467_part_00
MGLSPGAELDRGLRALTESQRAREAFEQMLRGGAAAEAGTAVHHGTGLAGGQPTPGRAEDDEPFAQSPPMTPEEEHEALQAQAWAAAERAEAAAARDRDSLVEDDRRGPRAGAGAAPATPQSTGLPVGLTLIQTSSGAVALESPRSPSDQAGGGSYMQGTAGGGGGMRQPQFGDGGGQQIETRGGTVLLPPPMDYHTEREARLCAERRVAELERRLREQQRAVRAPSPPTNGCCLRQPRGGRRAETAGRARATAVVFVVAAAAADARAPPAIPGLGSLGRGEKSCGRWRLGRGCLHRRLILLRPAATAASSGDRGSRRWRELLLALGLAGALVRRRGEEHAGGVALSRGAARAAGRARGGGADGGEPASESGPAPPRPTDIDTPAPTDTSASLRWAPVGWGRSSRRTPRSTGGCWPAATTTGWTRGRGSWRGRTACRWAVRSRRHLRDRGGEGACRCRPPTRRRRG